MDKLNEIIDFYEMTEDEPELLVMLLELRRHRQDNWKQRAEAAEALNNHLELAVRKAEGVSEALRRRAESAEAAVDTWRKESAYNLQGKNDVKNYARELEAQLAELAKQEPVAWLVLNSSEGYVERNPDVVAFLEAAGLTKCQPLFTGPAPASYLGWISCRDQMPENLPGKWSAPVAAVSDMGDVFQLSCMGGYWQRTAAFVESGATEVVKWLPLDAPAAVPVDL